MQGLDARSDHWGVWRLQEDIEEMLKYCDKPLIFPLSNPSSKAEITADKAYEYSHGKCVYASGASPCLLVCSSLPGMQPCGIISPVQAHIQSDSARTYQFHPRVPAHVWTGASFFLDLEEGKQGVPHLVQYARAVSPDSRCCHKSVCEKRLLRRITREAGEGEWEDCQGGPVQQLLDLPRGWLWGSHVQVQEGHGEGLPPCSARTKRCISVCMPYIRAGKGDTSRG